MIPPHTLFDGAASVIVDADQVLIMRACKLSPFFLRTLQSDDGLLPLLAQGLHRAYTKGEMQAFLAAYDSTVGISDEETLKRALRQLRRDVILRLIARDLNGLADFTEVVASCTQLAELALNVAVHYLHGWQRAVYGSPVDEHGQEQELIVVGMGKLGGGELNVSSDIDLIFAYAEDGVTTGEPDGKNAISNHEYFSRLGKKLISAIGEVTEEGFVFRVDMRLRPDGDSGPLVSSFEALEQYYQMHGREWERFAWIKGRVVVGEPGGIEKLLNPFVYRKYLDFGAIEAMRALKQRIEREVSGEDMQDNIKQGWGGIREVEFLVQVFQLIRGGRQPQLQLRSTLQALNLLADRGLLEPEIAAGLRIAYVFLRDVEHHLQYLHDAQTQCLPQLEEDRERIALGMDCTDWRGFAEALNMHRQFVAAQFAAVFSEKTAAVESTELQQSLWADILEQERWPEAQQALNTLNYKEHAVERLRAFAHGSRYRQLPQLSQKRIAALMPTLLQEASTFANADETLGRMLDLLEAVCRRASYLALFAEYPQVLNLVARLCAASPWLSAYLAQHPLLLDELLDTDSLYAAPDFAALAEELEQRLRGVDVESQLDVLRHFKQAQTFRFAAQDIMGHLPLETLSDYLSALADMLLEAVLCHAWAGLKQAHRATPAFALIAYGKLGGKEFGYASDVDLVFLYDDEAEGAGEEPVRDIYARFAQRINHWLSSPTTAGMLYEVDLRLRPDGASGLLVSSVAAFADYQHRRAWTWEHQALTRARFCAGDADIGEKFEQIRLAVLCQPRDAEKLTADVRHMRHKMLHEHPNSSGLFDLKHDQGGIVDVEFIVQTLVLMHAHTHPELSRNLGNIALLAVAGELRLIPVALAQQVAQAYRLYRQHQHSLRLQGESRSRMDRALFTAQIAQVMQLWQLVLGPF